MTAIEFARRSAISWNTIWRPAASSSGNTILDGGLWSGGCTPSRRARASPGIRRMKARCRCGAVSAVSTSACPTSSGTRSTRTCRLSPSTSATDLRRGRDRSSASAQTDNDAVQLTHGPSGLTAGLNAQGGLINGRGEGRRARPDDWERCISTTGSPASSSRSGRTLWSKATTSGRAGTNMYVRYDVNRFNGDLLDGRFDGIMPGVSHRVRPGSIDQEPLPRRDGRRDASTGPICSSAPHTPWARPSTTRARSRRRRGPTRTGPRHRTKDHRMPTSAQAVARGDLDDSGAVFGVRPRPPAGGWQLAGMLIAQSGSPFSVVCNGRSFTPIRDPAGSIVGNSGCDYNADGPAIDRPNVPTFGSSLSGLSNDDYPTGIFTASDFPTPAPGCRACSDGIRTAARAISMSTSRSSRA